MDLERKKDEKHSEKDKIMNIPQSGFEPGTCRFLVKHHTIEPVNNADETTFYF